jgi:predicted RNase H-like HicB family nuclease
VIGGPLQTIDGQRRIEHVGRGESDGELSSHLWIMIGEIYRSARRRGSMPLTIEVEQEEDGRWLAEVPELPGVLTYGQTRQEAIDRAQALSLRVLADRLEHGEVVPQMKNVFAVAP